MDKAAGILMFILLCCANTPVATPTASEELAKFKAQVMSADYRADLKELARLRDELAKWPKDRELAYLARYWAGFASWRIAINGANHDMKPDELKSNLQSAATSFFFAIQLKDDFADAYAAAAGVNAWLAKFFADAGPDRVPVMERVSLMYALLSHASILDPQNPRMLWIRAGIFQFAPGGSVTKAIEVYEQMLKEADRRGVDPSSPFPDWGKPEALMSLAFARSSQNPPDLAAARDLANAALKIQPEWSYVRENLLPGIEQRIKVGK